jgi:hypothetical protein
MIDAIGGAQRVPGIDPLEMFRDRRRLDRDQGRALRAAG